MEQNQPIQQLTKKERKALRRLQKQQERITAEKQAKFKGVFKILLIAIIIVVPIGLLSWYIATRPSLPESEIISKNGLHWHPQLSISIKGKRQEISKDIGIGATHQPIHTHDASGALHMEMNGLITKEQTKLGNFFRIWGKEFNSSCIFDKCNGKEGKVRFFVNGQENNQFENYLMKDKDKIEIKYE